VTSTPRPPADNYADRGGNTARRSGSGGRVFAVVVGFLACAAIGATLGWTLTPTPRANAQPPASSPPSSPSSSASPTPSPSQTPSSTPTQSGNQYTLPDYSGTAFQDARNDLRNHKIGVDLVFNSSGTAQTVNHTVPGAGQSVPTGHSVKVFVNGPPPPLAVPPIEPNTVCQTWGSQLAALGFKIARYQGDRTKFVTAESPDQNDPTTHWNTAITLTCGDSGGPPSSPPTDSPSPSPSTSP
jgi:hypothetical protein